MTSPATTPLRGAAVAVVSLALVGALIGAFVVVFAADDNNVEVAEQAPEPEPAPEPVPEPEPEPEPEPPPVVDGVMEVAEVHDLSDARGELLGSSGDRPIPVDEAAVDAFAEQVDRWIDDALTRVNREGDTAGFGPVAAENADVLMLSDPDRPIVDATYRAVVGAFGTPEWARVDVRVTRADGSEAAATLAVTAGTPPALLAASAGAEDAVADTENAE